MSNFVYDEHVGTVRNKFTAEIEGDCVVFRALDGERDDLDGLVGRIDSGSLGALLCSIVVPRKGGRVCGAAGPLGIRPGHRIEKKDAPQYALAEGGVDSVLSVARQTGPIFGNYHRYENGFDMVVEPLVWWRQAAGALRLAVTLKACINGMDSYDLLDDEVVFLQAADLTRAVPGAHPDMMAAAVYAKDDPFCGAYERMLTFDEASRPRLFPVTRGGYDGVDTYVRADYCDLWHDEGLKERIACSSAKRVEASAKAGGLLAEMIEFAKRADPDFWRGGIEGEAICPKSIFGYRVQVSTEGKSPMSVSPATLLEELSGEGGFSLLMGNDSPILSESVRLPLYEDLYDALVTLHTWRCSPDLRRGVDTAPFFTCALERIWHAVGHDAPETRMAFCPTCGQAFKTSGKRKYCSESCQERHADEARKQRRETVEKALRACPRGRKLSACDVALATDGRLTEGQVLAQLEKLKELKDLGGIRVRSTGGNGRGQRFIVEDVR